MDDAIQTVMTQCELWTDNTDMESELVDTEADKSVKETAKRYHTIGEDPFR